MRRPTGVLVAESDDNIEVELVLQKPLWDQVKAMAEQLAERGEHKTPEQVAAMAIKAGLSMTHGVG
jgi:hypothetical protein